jgi:hypothetical protein
VVLALPVPAALRLAVADLVAAELPSLRLS